MLPLVNPRVAMGQVREASRRTNRLGFATPGGPAALSQARIGWVAAGRPAP